MTYIADLAPFTYLGRCETKALAIGWLESGHDFPTGEVHTDLVPALEWLFHNAWEPICAGGWHDCSVCGRQPGDGPLTREIEGQRVLLGVKNLLVPAGDVIYGAPSLIIHYIEAHEYAPPNEFVDALLGLEREDVAYDAECRRLWGKAGV